MSKICRLTLLFLALNAALCFQLAAQVNIKGTVKEDDTGVLIPYSKVSVLNAGDFSVVQTTDCDENGSYELRNVKAGHYVLRASLIGYDDQTHLVSITVSSPAVVEQHFTLSKENPRLLEEVTVTAKRPLIEYKGDVILLNVENNLLTTGNNIWELLGKSPGIESSATSLSILGTSGASVLINGRSTYLQGEQLANMLKGMSADQVAQIEIIKNPSAKYDAGQGMGIINIRLKRAESDGFNGNLIFTYGQGRYDKYNPVFNFNYKSHGFSAFGNYSWVNTRDYRREPSYVDYRESAVPVYFDQQQYAAIRSNNNSLVLGLNYEISENSNIGIQINEQTIRRKQQYENNTNIIAGNALDSMVTTTSALRQPSNLQLYNAYYNTTINKTMTLTANADFAHFTSNNGQDYTFLYFNPDNSERRPAEFYRNSVPAKLSVGALSSDLTRKLQNNVTLEAGIKSSLMYNNTDITYERLVGSSFTVDPSLLNTFNYRELINSAYVTLQKSYAKFMFKAGMRAEQTVVKGESLQQGDIVNTDYLRWFPSLVMEYKIHDNHQLNFSYTTSFVRPNYSYLNPLPIIRDPNAYSTGNPFLRPSYTNTMELSYTLNRKYRVAIQVDDINDRIEQSVQQDYENMTLQNIIANIDKCYYYRIYFIIPTNVTKWWQSNIVWNNYIIQYKTPFMGGTYNVSKPVFYINANNSFRFPKGFTGELLAYYRTPSLNGLYHVGARFFVDMGVRKTFSENLSVGLTLTDLFHTNRWMWDIDYLNQFSGYETINDTRVLRFNVNYKFGNSKLRAARRNVIGISSERERMR